VVANTSFQANVPRDILADKRMLLIVAPNGEDAEIEYKVNDPVLPAPGLVGIPPLSSNSTVIFANYSNNKTRAVQFLSVTRRAPFLQLFPQRYNFCCTLGECKSGPSAH
jgi:hypothetical protein